MPTYDDLNNNLSDAGALAGTDQITVWQSGLAKKEDLTTLATYTVQSHEADTTNVHGILDTGDLLDQGDIGVSVQAHDADLDTLATGALPTNLQTTLDARYVRDTPIYLGTMEWKEVAGAVGLSQLFSASANRIWTWAFDASSEETIGTTWIVPTGWTSVDVSVVWVNSTADAGDVVWRMNRTTFADGGATNANTVGTSVTATAGSQYGVEVTTLETDLAVTAGNIVRFSLARVAGDAADTKAGDAGVIGVVVQRHP